MSQQPYPYPAPVPPPPPSGRWQPERVEPVPGTEFALVSLLVLCFGLAGAQAGWGALVAGAFTLLSVIGGAGAIVVGLAARRQIRGSGSSGQVRFTGRGIAVAGISCGAV